MEEEMTTEQILRIFTVAFCSSVLLFIIIAGLVAGTSLISKAKNKKEAIIGILLLLFSFFCVVCLDLIVQKINLLTIQVEQTK